MSSTNNTTTTTTSVSASPVISRSFLKGSNEILNCPHLIAKRSSKEEEDKQTNSISVVSIPTTEEKDPKVAKKEAKKKEKEDAKIAKRRSKEEEEATKLARRRSKELDEDKHKKYKHHDYHFHGEEWTYKSAEDKLNALWNAITQFSEPNKWDANDKVAHVLKSLEGLAEDFHPAFDYGRDNLPTDGAFHVFTRHKVIHRTGTVAKAKLVIHGNPSYTGIFKSGCKNAIIRFSSSVAYSATPRSFVPGISLKFLRTNKASANILAYNTAEGVDTFNFFKHDFSNTLPEFSADGVDFGKKMLLKKTTAVSAFPFKLGVSDVCAYDEDGNSSDPPVFPYRVYFQPKKHLRNLFPDDFVTSDLASQIMTLKPGPIFNVFAEAFPYAKPELIGFIEMTTVPINSSFGDNALFFAHQKKEDDFEYHPEWEKPTLEICEKQRNTHYPNVDPDLPYLEGFE